jgi:hypothetical protein
MAYFIFLKYLRSLEEFRKNSCVQIPPKSPCANFQILGILKKSIFITKEFFFNFRPNRPSGQPAHPTFLAPSSQVGPHPVLTAPIPILLPSSPSLSFTTSELLYRRRFTVVARPSHRLTSPGERRAGFTVLPSPHPTLAGELPSSRAVRAQAPASGPWWTEPSAVREPWTESTIISYCKIILKPEKCPPSCK